MRKFERSRRNLWLIFMTAVASIMAAFSIIRHSKSQSVSREVFLTTKDANSIDPSAVVRASDGGFFVAGSEINAWAAKTDAQGTLLWTYMTDFKPFPYGTSVGFPTFAGAAAMLDGSAYFCGFFPQPAGGYDPGLLTHLDAQGNVLNQRLIVPAKRSARGIAVFDDCVRWGDGVAVLGHIVDFPPPVNGVFPSEINSYWLVVIDAGGNVNSETQIASLPNLIEFGPLLPLSNSSLGFSATNNMTTQLVRVDVKGKVVTVAAQKILAGRFKLVRPVDESKYETGIIQIFGHSDPKNRSTPSAITLDEKLDEIQKIQGAGLADFIPYLVYRMPDHSFVLFGSAVHHFGARYSARAMHMNQTLTLEQRLELPYNVFDLGVVAAAAPTGTPGVFLTAREFRIVGGDASLPGHLPIGFKLGAVLDFVHY